MWCPKLPGVGSWGNKKLLWSTYIPFVWFCFPWFVQDIFLVRCGRVIYVAQKIAPRSDSLTWLDLLQGDLATWAATDLGYTTCTKGPHEITIIFSLCFWPTRSQCWCNTRPLVNWASIECKQEKIKLKVDLWPSIKNWRKTLKRWVKLRGFISSHWLNFINLVRQLSLQ